MADMYDGFISYSHAADDLLAPRLQSALQRFAKPWWKRRAVRIFRDESSLSANPHLWSSIAEALDTSGWFVLLLSPDAASSEWVNQEIAYWVENRDPRRILPVVTDGTFSWDGEVTGDAVPAALRGVFSEEPRWVDLRFARHEEQLDLQHPEFNSAIADIASTIRGIPKDELASEEVRQHRRTVRTAWAAGGLVAILAIAAVGFGISSARNADEAERQAEIAAEQADLAQANASAEATARAEADANAAEAEANAALAQARELAASAIGVVDEDPRLATLLVLAAVDATPAGQQQPAEVIDALWKAASADPLEAEIPLGFGGYSFVGVSPDGQRLAVATAAGAKVELRDSDSFEVLWTYSEETTDAFIRPLFSPDGSLIALDVTGAESGSPWTAGSDVDDRPDRVLILDAETGGLVTAIEFPDCSGIWGPAWSPGGRLLAVSTAFRSNCPRPEVGDPRWIEVFDASTWDSLAVLGMPEPDNGVSALFLSEDRLGAFRIQNPLEVYDSSTFELVEVLEDVKSPITPAVSEASGLIASHSNFDLLGHVYDLETGTPLDILGDLEAWPEIPYGVSFAQDGTLIAFATGGRVLVWDVSTGEQIFRLTAGAGASNAVFSPDGTRLYSGHQDGVVRVWNLRPGGSVAQHLGSFPAGSFVNGNTFSIGAEIGTVHRLTFEPFSSFIEFFSAASGELIAPTMQTEGDAITLPDDRVVLQPRGEDLHHFYQPRSGESKPIEQTGCPEGCFLMPSANRDEFALAVSVDENVQEWRFFDATTGALTHSRRYEGQRLSPWRFGKEWVLHSEGFSDFVFQDRETGDELLRVPMETRDARNVSHDGRTVVLSPGQDLLTVVDTAAWEATVLDLGFGRMRGAEFNADDSLLAVADEDAVSIVDLERKEIVQQVPFALVSDIHWISDTEILIGNRDGTLWGTVTLDTDQLIESARRAVRNRPFTSQECTTYRIDPCPSEGG